MASRKFTKVFEGPVVGPVTLKSSVEFDIGAPIASNGTDIVPVETSQSLTGSHTVIGVFNGKMSDTITKSAPVTGDGTLKCMADTGVFKFPVKSGDSPAASVPGTTVYCTLDAWEAAATNGSNTRPVLGKLVGVDPTSSSFVFVFVGNVT